MPFVPDPQPTAAAAPPPPPPPPPAGRFVPDTGAASAPAPVQQVGFLESALRTAGLIARTVVGTVDQAAAGFAGLAGDTAGQEDIFRNMEQRQQRMSEAYAPKEGERFNRGGALLGGLGMAGAGLMAAGSGAGGQERAREVIQRGGTLGEAAVAGGAKAGTDAALAALPAGAGRALGPAFGGTVGRQMAGGAITGVAINVPAGAAARAVENAALPEGEQFKDLQQPLMPDAAEVGMSAAMGALGGRGGPGAAKQRTEAAAKATAAQAKADALEAPQLERIQRAREAGYVLTPTEGKGGKISRGIEGLAGEPKLAKAASEKNAQVTNDLIRKDLGLADDVPLSREALADIRAEEGQAYDAVKKAGRISVGKDFQTKLDEIARSYDTAAESFEHRSEKPFQRVMDGLRGKRDADGNLVPRSEFAATAAVEEVKLLRNDADKAYRAGDKALGKAYRQMAQALDDAMDAHLQKAAKTNPALADAVAKYRAARVRIAKTYTADKALNDASGNIDAAVYARELKKGAPLTGGARQVAEFAQQFPRLAQRAEKIGSTGPTFADAGLALLGQEALLLGARPAARAALLSERGQRMFVKKPKEPEAPPPEPELTAGQTPFPPRDGGAPPEGPLGDLTPDWETSPGAGGAPAPTGVDAGDLYPAAGEDVPPMRMQGSEPPAPVRRAGEQIPAVPGRPDLPDVMVAGAPREVAADTATGAAMQSENAQLAREQQGFEPQPQRPEAPERIPAGEATEIEMPDPRLVEIENLQKTAQSDVARKALAAEAAKIRKELKDRADTRQREDDADELRRLAARADTPTLRESLLAQAAKVEAKAKLPVGEATELTNEPATGRAPEMKPLPAGQATEVPPDVPGGRAPALEQPLPVGEATPITDSGVEPVPLVPAGEARELYIPPEKTDAPREVPQQGSVQQERVQGDEGRPAAEAGGGDRVQRAAPGAGQEGKVKQRGKIPEGVTIKERDWGLEVLGPDGKTIGYLRDNLRRGQAEQLGENASVDMVKLEPGWRGKGIADALYNAFSERHGGRIAISGKTEASAMRVWKRLFPEKVNAYVEQEAQRIRDGASRELVLGNIKDPEVRGRVAEAAARGSANK